MAFYRFGFYLSSTISIVLALMLIAERRVPAVVTKNIPSTPASRPVGEARPDPARSPSLPAAEATHSTPFPPASASTEPKPADSRTFPAVESPSPTQSPAEDTDRTRFRVNARISAIEKFVQVSDSQRERLQQKFSDELANRKTADQTETLDDILGAENAQYYRDQVKQAVARAKDEESERELYYQSRKLGLSAEQEDQFRTALQSTEAQVEQQSPSSENADMHARMQQMLREEALREQLLDERLAQILTAEQYQRYIEQRQQSSSADFQVFHDPGK
ncbi:MAG: hypothetical protein U0136_10045 [Bdellovibrionota bacterium]